MRGRKPKPTAFKIINGNPGCRPLNGSEPKPKAGAPPCPAWLDREAKAEWKRIVPELARLGVLTRIDRAAIAAYCQAWSEFHAATRQVQREGRTVTTAAGGIKPHPAVNQQRSAWAGIRAFATLFGLDPSSRSRLHVDAAQPADDDFEDFVNRGKKQQA